MAISEIEHETSGSGGQETYSITLILSGFDELTDEIADAVYGSGCDDALLGIEDGVPYLDFDRKAESLDNAFCSAISDLEKCKVPIKVERVELNEGKPIGQADQATVERYNEFCALKRLPLFIQHSINLDTTKLVYAHLEEWLPNHK